MNHHPPAVSFFSFLIILITAAVAAFALTYPLLGSLGPESGLIFGVVIGPLMYLSGSVRGAYRDQRGFSHDLIHELSVGMIAFLLFSLVLAFNSLFAASCAPARGILPFAVHAVPVIVFDAACGILIGRIVGKRWLAFLVAILIAGAHLLSLVALWWKTPGFRIFSHPYLILDGDLWNGAGFSTEVIAFKTTTLILSIAVIIAGSSLFPSETNSTFSQKASRPYQGLFAAVACLLIGIIAHVIVTERIQPSRDSLNAELSRRTRRGALVVHSDPTQTSLREAQAILAEANLWRNRLKARIGAISTRDIHIWLYADSDTLTKYTGAAHVHFALPKHREIHISHAVVPHPTLGHELAHVLIGEKTTTLLGVPGAMGVLANQGLTEGLAMMLTPQLSIKNDLTLEEQASALAQSARLPRKDALFSLSPFSFFATNSSMAYSVAGAYLQELVRRAGESHQQRAILISKLAHTGRVETTPFDDLIFQEFATQSLPKDAIPSVVALFGAKPVLASTCKDKDLNNDHRVSDALVSARLAQARAQSTSDNEIQEKLLLLEAAGDFFWRAGEREKARNTWKQIDAFLLPPQKQRTVQAKSIFADTYNSNLSSGALDYLISSNNHQTSIGSAAKFAITFAQKINENEREHTADVALSEYLLLRAKILATGSYEDLDAMRSLASADILPESFRNESFRLRAVALALGPKAAEAKGALSGLANANIRPALSLQLDDIAERSELIATALTLPRGDPRRGDMWLLGINRFDQ